MGTNSIILAVVALIPAIALGIYIFVKDRVEKEPIGLLLLLAVAGALTCFPAAWGESLMYSLNDAIFSPFGYEKDGITYMSSTAYFLYQVVQNFLCIALVEEGVKFLALYLITHKNKNFNSLFDGVIYAVFVSLGFAALENVKYAFNYGMDTALLRAFTAVPGHMFDGVLMGYFYTMWHLNNKCKTTEKNLIDNGWISRPKFNDSGKRELAFSLIVPVLAHGFYDFCCSYDSSFATIIFFAFLAALYIYCFGKINKLSKLDRLDNDLAAAMIYKAHPGLFERIVAAKQAQQNTQYNNY